MDVKAILLVGGHPQNSENIAGVPVAMLDVLGEPVLQRVIDRISRLGITATTVISETPDSPALAVCNRMRPDIHWVNTTREEIWRAAEHQFSDFAQKGAELVLVARLGPFLDMDYEEFVQFHLDRRARVSVASDDQGVSFDCFLINASRRNDAAHLFRNELRSTRGECQEYIFNGYSNRLRNAADLRALAMASFAGECSIRPSGEEIKPGVWASDTATVHRRARLLAPAYIGRHANIRASAVITRGSVIEHHSVIDCGAVVEGSSILPHTYVGAGLDVANSIVGFRHIASVPRNVCVEIMEERFIGVTSISAPMRTLTSAMQLVGVFPKALFAGFRRKEPANCTAGSIPEAIAAPSPALSAIPQNEDGRQVVPNFNPSFLTARRYGNE
jgi:NDP-sugar pyrophosphorylase family protein